MLYTPLQVREAAGIPKETLRYWRKSLPFLIGGNSYKPRYEPGDLLAFGVIRLLCVDLGMNIKGVTPFAQQIFVQLKAEQWSYLRSCYLVVDFGRRAVEVVESVPPNSLKLSCVISLGDLISELTDKLLAGANLGSQTVLNFPSSAVRT